MPFGGPTPYPVGVEEENEHEDQGGPAASSGGSTAPGTRLPAPERRQQLLDVSLEIFAARGFHGASMNDVAEAAGVTKPVLYQHFDSKDALYLELVDEMGQRLEEAIMKAVADADGPRQQVEAGFRAYFRWCIGQGAAFQVIFAERNRADPELAGAAMRVERMVADRVASLIAIEGLSDDARHVLALGVVGIAESTSRHWLRLGLGEGTDADDFAEQVAGLAWSGLRGIHQPSASPGSPAPSSPTDQVEAPAEETVDEVDLRDGADDPAEEPAAEPAEEPAEEPAAVPAEEHAE